MEVLYICREGGGEREGEGERVGRGQGPKKTTYSTRSSFIYHGLLGNNNLQQKEHCTYMPYVTLLNASLSV